MLHILILILKIIGILLLVILGLLLTAVLLILFVPLRYRVHALHGEETKGSAVLTWLLHLLSIRITYDGKAALAVRVCGYPLIRRQIYPEETDLEGEEPARKEKKEFEKSREGNRPADETGGAAGFGQSADDFGTSGEPFTEARIPRTEPEAVSVPEPQEYVPAMSASETQEHGGPPDEGDEDELVQMAEVSPESGKPGFFAVLIRRIKEKFERITRGFHRFCGELKRGRLRFEEAKEFIEDEENRKTFRLLMTQTKKLFRHLLPRKLKGWVRFGFEDPYMTGQVLSAVSPFYGLYGKSVSLEPVFGEAVLHGEIKIKGHIRTGTLIFICLRVWMNRNFRILLKRWMK